MPRSSVRSKQVTHQRIVDAGARALRHLGFDRVAIIDVMRQAGLTHGGFYAHFESREALLVEATDRVGANAANALAHIAACDNTGEALSTLLRAYLSMEHVRNPDLIGCPVVALGTEMPRQAPEVRQAATHHIEKMVDVIAGCLPELPEGDAQEQALVASATMFGAVVLARAVNNPALSEAVLKAALHHLSCDAGRSSNHERTETSKEP